MKVITTVIAVSVAIIFAVIVAVAEKLWGLQP